MALRVFAFALVLASAATAFAAENPNDMYGAATVAPFRQAPVIDGRLSPGEWDGAMAVTGFLANGPGAALDARTGTTYVGFTKERLYIAVVSAYPPDGKEHSSGKTRDKLYIFDECLEVWLDPNRDHRQTQKGDLRFYQMIANAEGGIYDVSFDPKGGPSTGWNGNWELRSTIDPEKHVWTAEMSLPFADLGWKPGDVLGKTLGVLVARNYKNPWSQATAFPVMGAFIDWYRYSALRLTPDAPSVQVAGLGEKVHAGEMQLQARIANPGPARAAKVRLLITSSDMPELREEREVALPAGGSAPYAFSVPAGRLHEDAKHALALDVTSPDGQETYLHYRMTWSKAPARLWEYRLGPNPDAAVRFAYYPSYKLLRVLVDTRELGKDVEATSRKAAVTLTGPDGKEILARRMAWEKAPATQEYALPDLPDGEYRLSVAVDGWKDAFVRTFKRVRFPFEGNTLGVTDQVLPPFTPVAVKGNTVSVVCRDYTVDGLGLWRSVKAAGNVSAGPPRELLAAPMALKADSGAGPVALQGKGSFTQERPNQVVYEGQASTPAVAVKTRCTTEVDGVMKVELTLAPGTQRRELKSLALEIPLQDRMAPLWHVTSTTLRVNPAGATPAGQGVVWDSRQFPDGTWYGNFKCYLWLGAEERGLCWFADNDRGWELSVDEQHPERSAPCQELIRKNGVLTLRVNLVQKPVTITEPRTLVFGLMASPGKPLPADWRRRDVLDASRFNMGYASPATYCAKTPWGGDFAIADWAYAKRTGRPGPTKEQTDAWVERNIPKSLPDKVRQPLVNLALGPFLGSFGPGQKYYKMYFEEFHTNSQAHPESEVFQSEWSGDWYHPLVHGPTSEAEVQAGIGVAGIVPSYRDFACYYGAEWIKRGIGLYFDNAFPTAAFDPLTTAAYRLPDGRIQPSAGMWARREYLRRIWTLHRTLAPKDALPAMMIHMTNTLILPYMVWNDEDLDLEWKFGPEPQQSKFGPEFLRAETLGRQAGNVPWALDRVMDEKSPEQKHLAHRTRFGTMMVHEIRWWGMGEDVEQGMLKVLRDFGYGLEDCRSYDYWDERHPVKSSDPEAKTLLLQRGPDLLLLVCTWNPQPANVTFTLDRKAIGVSPAAAIDAEEPAKACQWDARAGRLSLALEGYGVRMIRLR